MSVRFVYQAVFHAIDEDLELLEESVSSSFLNYDNSEDRGPHGMFCEEALEILRQRFPQPENLGHYVVLLAGKMIFTQDYYGECDSYFETEWSHVERQDPPAQQEFASMLDLVAE